MPPAKTTQINKLLDQLIEKGPALREAGYLSIEVEGCKLTLAPAAEETPEIPLPLTTSEESMRQYVDALDDPDTYSREGEGTPGYYQGRRQGPLSNDGALPLDA